MDEEIKNKLSGKMGNNGVVFGNGYKGPGMCKNCEYAKFYDKNTPYVNAPPMLRCTFYASAAKSVCRNCRGIRSLRDTPLTKPEWYKKPHQNERNKINENLPEGRKNIRGLLPGE